jgi:hypothetical protein
MLRRYVTSRPLVFVVLCFVQAIALVVAAGFLFAATDAASFGRKVAELLVQLALVVLIGAIVKLVFDLYLKSRADAELDQAKRIELLRRMRTQHIVIASAQYFFRAHDSGKTYVDQMKLLVIARAELEDIAEDLKVWPARSSTPRAPESSRASKRSSASSVRARTNTPTAMGMWTATRSWARAFPTPPINTTCGG